jgi:hypothetical protein
MHGKTCKYEGMQRNAADTLFTKSSIFLDKSSLIYTNVPKYKELLNGLGHPPSSIFM